MESYRLAILEINERIHKIRSETEILQKAIYQVKYYGDEYDKMTEQQQYNLITFVNLMESSTTLLINPVLGLQPKFTSEDLDEFLKYYKLEISKDKRGLYVFLSNLLYKIPLDDTDRKLLWKSLKGNKEFLERLGVSKKDFEVNDMKNISLALNYKY